MKLMRGYRGDTRDPDTLKSHGGFVPKYLLETHNGGLAGFIACQNKTDGQMGCNCGNFSETQLFQRARQKLINTLARSAMTFQQHVMFNNVGFLSTAIAQDDMYGGHGYQFWTEFQFECTVGEAAQQLGIPVRGVNNISRNFKILMNSPRIANATLIGVIPHNSVEISFISPVQYRYLKYLGQS